MNLHSRRPRNCWFQYNFCVHLTCQWRTDASGLEFGAILEQTGEDGFHKPIAYASRQTIAAQVKGLLARWYLNLAPFLPKMRLEYKPGSANIVADALSRAHH